MSCLSNTQNLVLNPSFEEHSTYKCLVYMGGFNNGILNWSIPNYGSTDFFDTCSKDMGKKNYNGSQKPKSGTSYAGMYYYTDKNYREYVQGQLSKTLSVGKRYKMTFYLSLADKSSYALKDIEVLITEEKLEPCHHSNNCEKTIKPSKATKKNFKMYSNANENYFSDKESWMEYTFEFTAEGYETYFSIGNFYRNPKTKKQKTVSDSPYFFSYYYIDDVSIETVEKEEKEEVIDEPEIKINEVYTFKNVLFDFDKAKLLKVSIEELDQLYKYLSQNSNLNIEIYGHTDNVGLGTRNKELSEQRAKAVVDYLISQGLNPSRIQFIGFGSSKPISENITEEGRQLNRRVEFKLIDS
ncbi:OmpA family protein [Winogradskyella sp. PE311]|uniref:OmpA family protein n=1 Tax=Winogradskyella sp. PE311 TaxID=3366943 RepID=UPI003980BBEA